MLPLITQSIGNEKCGDAMDRKTLHEEEANGFLGSGAIELNLPLADLLVDWGNDRAMEISRNVVIGEELSEDDREEGGDHIRQSLEVDGRDALRRLTSLA